MANINEPIVGLEKEYNFFLNEIKEFVTTSRLKAAISLNREVIMMYRQIF